MFLLVKEFRSGSNWCPTNLDRIKAEYIQENIVFYLILLGKKWPRWINELFAFGVLLSKGKDGDEQPQLTVDIGEPHTEEGLKETEDKGVDLFYSLNDRPPWYLCILLGFQVNSSQDSAQCAVTLPHLTWSKYQSKVAGVRPCKAA